MSALTFSLAGQLYTMKLQRDEAQRERVEAQGVVKDIQRIIEDSEVERRVRDAVARAIEGSARATALNVEDFEEKSGKKAKDVIV
eukprot:CAMPEP_0118978798 /NCGR_PEP_ID=MMETSP1173-20130426/24538_1 /TAXON_ID=1034831 /ORGANISM="Rhizochromulina marina cf, Strain CCMP1243" /LENGTH=84 /DNA_ID=CAMNT_0006929011 /DNA_START=47 /DNA_END=301 /DNA_ORIENTATION=-